MNRKILASILLLASCAHTTPTTAPQATTPERYANVPMFEKGGRISPPRPTYRFEPTPPPDFRQSRQFAAATVEAVIDSEGKVVDAWYVDGDREWAKILGYAVRRWKFTPATLDGVPISVRFRVSSTFKSGV